MFEQMKDRLVVRKRIVAGGVLFALVSAGVCLLGTNAQEDCFNDLENSYEVASIEDLSDKIVNDSGCVSVANTLGFLGTGFGLAAVPACALTPRRRVEPISPVLEVEAA